MARIPWGHVSRSCVYCGGVGPRVQVLGGWAHRRCVPKEEKPLTPFMVAKKLAGLIRQWRGMSEDRGDTEYEIVRLVIRNDKTITNALRRVDSSAKKA